LPRNIRGELHRRSATVVSEAHERARHLDRAAGYLGDDADLVVQAADALADAGLELIALARHRDAYRLLERAVALGCRRAPVLLDLGRLQGLYEHDEDALETLELIDDDPSDPSIAAERDHTAANVKVFSDASWAVPRLQAAAERWHELGDRTKEAWARANAGVGLFNLSRLGESARWLEDGLAIFDELGDVPGRIAASSFICLVKPEDKRVPGWLEEALAYADVTGDRGRQLGTLVTLTWNRFFKAMCGGPDEVLEAEAFAERLVALAQELDSTETCIHGLGLMSVMARMSGRLQEATRLAEALQRVTAAAQRSQPWLSWAVAYSAAVASGASGASPPFPPSESTDPVDSMARSIIEAELVLTGRVEEAVSHIERHTGPGVGALSDLTGIFAAVAFQLAGRSQEALDKVDRAAVVAETLEAPAIARMAAALRSEITGELGHLPPAPLEPETIADLLALRARAVHTGSAEALSLLTAGAKAFGMPGLLVGLPGSAEPPVR
jgi:tetratricopeptide (TPR) repeat protein